MTWLNHAHFLATFAAIASGIGTSRMVWNLSGSSPNASDRRTGFMLRLLALLSRLPWAIAVGSQSGRQAYEALGYRARHWFPLYNSARESATERVLDSYRQLWRFVSGIEPSSVRPGLLEQAFPWLKKTSVARLRRLSLARTTFIAITGSCGKTTTVRLAARMLAIDAPCYCREFHNVVRDSVMTVLSIPAFSKYCVQEVSGHCPGAIAKHVEVLKPNIAIVTTVGSDHYTNFRGLEATAKEKGRLVEALPRNGIAILNADDPHVRAMAARTRARVLLFGLSPDAEIRATEVSSAWPDRLTLTVVHDHESVRVHTKLVGEHWITSVLAAIACGIVCGIDLKTCAQIVERFDSVFGRYSIHGEPGGPAYVLDTNKASFWTIATGLAFVAEARASRKTIVFGTISDYPGATGQRYRRIARDALEVADRVVFVGPNAGSVNKLLRQEGLPERLFSFQTSYQASAFLAEDVLPQELIYIKASVKNHLERIMLSQLDQVVCWRERCRITVACPRCRYYRKPHAPPFGLAEVGSALVADSPQERPVP